MKMEIGRLRMQKAEKTEKVKVQLIYRRKKVRKLKLRYSAAESGMQNTDLLVKGFFGFQRVVYFLFSFLF